MFEQCETCKNLDPNNNVYGEAWMSGPVFEHHYIKLPDIIDHDQRGCNYCSLLANLVNNFVPNWKSKTERVSLHVTAPVRRPIQVRINEAPEPDVDLNELSAVVLSATEGINIPGFPSLGTARSIAQNSDDLQCFQFIQDRLNICRSHGQCSWSVRTVLPARVIDLGLDNGKLSLYESNNEMGGYAALSYCWGENSVLLKTTRSNLDAFRHHIPWSKLPRTLQDAITIVRKIGLRFIWIDCICIIQDDRADWEVEAAKMGQYYQSAFLTIAASASSSAFSGIFANRPKISPPKEVRFRGTDGVYYPIIAQTRDMILHPTSIHGFGPLSDRGWTLQEHALSTRMIHFTESEIIWECCTEMISEDGHPIRDNCHGLIQEFQEAAKKDPEGYWRLLIRAYSDRHLTLSEDKLPAIAGIAVHFQRQTGYQYVAGLWKDTLPIDLVWSSWGWVEADKPPKIFQSPSWSWASIDGGIAFAMETIPPDIPIDIHSAINNAQCVVLGRNPFGQVTKGTIDITGPLLEMTIRYNGEVDKFGTPQFRLLHGAYSESTFFPDTSLEQVEIRDKSGFTNWTVNRTSAIPTPFQATVWCLWIFTAHQEPSDAQKAFELEPIKLHGIVLARSDFSPEVYTRVGSVGTREAVLLGMASKTTLTII